MALSKIDVANMLTGATPVANGGTAATTLAGAGLAKRPNAKPLIINGDMAIWQRSTSTVTMSDGYYNLDRFRGEEGTDGTATWSRSTSVPDNTGLAYSLQVDCTGTDSSIGSSQQINVQQTIEAQNLQLLKWGTSDAEKVTLAFWVKSNQTGQHSVALRKLDNTAYNQPKTYTISSANTWEKKVLVFSALTSSGGAIANDNGDGLQILWKLSAGSSYQGTADTWTATNQGATAVSGDVNFMSSTDNDWYLTGVQLEVGEYSSTTLPPFQHESFADNLARCHRYCYVMGASQNAEDGGQFTIGSGLCRSSGSSIFTDICGTYPQPLRTLPSVTQVGGDTSDIFCYKDDGTSANPSSISIGRNTIALRLTNNMGTSSGLSAGDATVQQIVEDDTDLVFDAEL